MLSPGPKDQMLIIFEWSCDSFGTARSTDWRQKLAMGIATAFAAASLTGRMKESEMAFAMAPAKVPTTYLMLASMRVLVMAPVRVACDGSEVIFFKVAFDRSEVGICDGFL